MPGRSGSRLRDEIGGRIRAAGLRRTPARVAVVERLTAAAGPMTHAELAKALHKHGFDQATIYRNLVELTEVGILARFEVGDHVWRFELATKSEAGPQHPHFLCVDCGSVACLPDVQVTIDPAPGRKGFAIHSVTGVLLQGQCRDCG